jgi:cytochrome P450
LWGHLKLVGEYTMKFGPKTYIHYPFTALMHDYDLPDIFYLDLWPFARPVAVCTTPDAAAISTSRSLWLAPVDAINYFRNSVGVRFIAAANGQLWKDLHAWLAPGLTPAALRTHHSQIVHEALAVFDSFATAASGTRPVSILPMVDKLPFGMIGHYLFGRSMGEDAYKATRGLLDSIHASQTEPNPLFKWQLTRKRNQWRKRIGLLLQQMVQSRLSELKAMQSVPVPTNATPILDRLLVGRVKSGQSLDNDTMELILDKYVSREVQWRHKTTDETWAVPGESL